MEYRFKTDELEGDEWRTLTAAQKARRCRSMADETMDVANQAEPQIAVSYLRIAEDWLKLAAEFEGFPRVAMELAPR